MDHFCNIDVRMDPWNFERGWGYDMVHGKTGFGPPQTPIQFTRGTIFGLPVNRKFFVLLSQKPLNNKAKRGKDAL